MREQGRLRIVHVVRAPIGGIFRHIVDLAAAQTEAGHAVGIVCDSSTGGAFEDHAIATIADKLALGITRFPMRRNIAPSDFFAARRVLGHLAGLAPDVIHGHGAKGGAYGRLIGTILGRERPVARLYAPHGGSLHYDERSTGGRIYFAAERLLQGVTDAIVHVSAYEAETYRHKVGVPRCRAVVILNGLRPEEYTPVKPAPDARDLLYLGMFRDLKGTDVFLSAVARLEKRYQRHVTACLIGQADADFPRYHKLAHSLDIMRRIEFHNPKPTRTAFALAHAIVVPSRAESMPYVVLEAIAAGLPIVATRVGGIPEIFGPRADELVAPGDPDALAGAIERLLADPCAAQKGAAERRDWVRQRFSINVMQKATEGLYREILAAKAAPTLGRLQHKTA